MTKDDINTYSLRIAQANQSELTVITFEIFADYINDAVNCYKMENMDEYRIYINKAKAMLSEIMAALNYKNVVSFSLVKIYTFVYKSLVSLYFTPDPVLIEDIREIMAELREAFDEVAKKDGSGCVMDNAEQLYAGLTYGKGYLNETSIRKGDNAGWKA